MKKIVIGLFFVFCIVFGLSLSPLLHSSTQNSEKVNSSVMGVETKKNNPISIIPSPNVPKTISIPTIAVNATVEQVGEDSQGRMETPKNNVDTAWYDAGFRPGEKGNAVIDGHLDTVTGSPAVFWNIKKLHQGDRIIITDADNKQYTFAVSKVAAYPYNQLPLAQIFAASTTPHLNLITCNGTWDKITKNYSQRIVVYSELQ